MPVLFACPHCGTETVVDDVYVGQSGPCATCGKVVTVPEMEGTVPTLTERAAKAGLNLRSAGMLLGVVIGSLVAGLGIIALTVMIVAPAVQAARAASQKAKSADRLELIAQALQSYHATYGSFPPAYVADANGKPMHSWRVLLLPFLGERRLYDQYDFSQPWNQGGNLALTSQMPDVYASPGDEDALASYNTSYVVIVGPDTMFPGAKSLSLGDISDGAESTVLIVEYCESGICWMEPKDLDATRMSYTINAGATDCIRSHHPFGAHALFADGTTHFLTEDLPPEIIEALVTPRKGDDAPIALLGDE